MTIALALPSDARGETGYDLWLRYHKVTDSARLSEYRAAISELVMQGDSPTLRIVREELGAGLGGLLGRPLTIVPQPTSSGAVIVGTPASSQLIASLPLTAELRSVGPDGFVVRTMAVSGRRALVVAANRDVGVLYGAFHLLRLMQTNRPLAAVNVTSAPRIQLRMLDHWDNLDRSVERGYAGPSLWDWRRCLARSLRGIATTRARTRPSGSTRWRSRMSTRMRAC